MTTNQNQPRKSKGTPVGGQFAGKSNPESYLELPSDAIQLIGVGFNNDQPPQVTAPEPLKEVSRGVFQVTDTVAERLESDPGSSFTRTAMHIGGQPHRRAAADLAGLVYQNGSDRDIETEMRGGALNREKASVLVQMSSGAVDVHEGTLVTSNGIAVLSKGSRTKGHYIFGRSGAPRVLDYLPGYGHAPELAAKFRESEAKVPPIVKSTFDDIPVHDGQSEPPSDVVAAFVITHPGFDKSQDGRGCVFFATDRDPEEVVNGYFVAPPGSGLSSEHGSFTTDQLERWGGRVDSFKPGSMSFRDAMKLGDESYEDMRPAWKAAGFQA